MLADELADHAEMILNGQGSLVNPPAQPALQRRERQQRDQRQAGQGWIDGKHGRKQNDGAGDRVDHVHERGTGHHPGGQEVVGRPGDEIAHRGAIVVRRREGHQFRKQIVPKVELDPAAHAVEQLTHAVSKEAAEHRGPDQQEGGLPGLPDRVGPVQRIDALSQEFGGQGIQQVGPDNAS